MTEREKLAMDKLWWQARCEVVEEENAKLREVIDDITEVVEASDPALVQFIAKRMKRIRTEEDV